MAEWDIDEGTTLLRRHLHDQWGGGRYGGMEPSVRAASVFLFTQPAVGNAFGYKYDGWHEDGTFHYTGDGQQGDQSPDEGGNRALLRTSELGRTVRLFHSEGVNTTYLGVYELADPPYYRAEAPDRDGVMRSVLVFRLVPDSDAMRLDDTAPGDLGAPEEIPLEANNLDAYAVARPEEPAQAMRREADLVRVYAEWLAAKGATTVRHRVPLPDGGYLFTDLYDKSREELVEAKSSFSRAHVRTGLGQVLDYSRFVHHKASALLLPGRPAADLVSLLHSNAIAVIWREEAGFARLDP